MKKQLLTAVVLLPIACMAQLQQPDTGKFLFTEGLRQLNGVGIAANPIKAFNLFKQSATSGNAQAMNALGNVYTLGTGVAPDIDAAINWYKAAADKGYSKSYFNLGMLYQKGDFVKQNYYEAARYYKLGADAGNVLCKNLMGYLHYKGLGVTQSYAKAFGFYSEAAEMGDVNAQYFLGTMYRNGYGTSVDNTKAKYWLKKAAENNYPQAIQELTKEPLPENRSVISPELQNKVAKLKAYQESYTTLNNTDISGTYTGYAVYYDFSKTYVHEIVPLTLTIKKTDGEYLGTWTEGDTLTAPLKGYFKNNTFCFDSSSQYTRYNYYSYHTAEPYRFDKAMLGIKYMGDSMFLNGDVQFYSIGRKEPGQPMYISLSKQITPDANPLAKLQLELSPNPATSFVKVQFTLTTASSVRFVLSDATGKPLQQTPAKMLPSGAYTHQFDVNKLAAGSYVIQAYVNNIPSGDGGKIFIKL